MLDKKLKNERKSDRPALGSKEQKKKQPPVNKTGKGQIIKGEESPYNKRLKKENIEMAIRNTEREGEISK